MAAIIRGLKAASRAAIAKAPQVKKEILVAYKHTLEDSNKLEDGGRASGLSPCTGCLSRISAMRQTVQKRLERIVAKLAKVVEAVLGVSDAFAYSVQNKGSKIVSGESLIQANVLNALDSRDLGRCGSRDERPASISVSGSNGVGNSTRNAGNEVNVAKAANVAVNTESGNGNSGSTRSTEVPVVPGILPEVGKTKGIIGAGLVEGPNQNYRGFVAEILKRVANTVKVALKQMKQNGQVCSGRKKHDNYGREATTKVTTAGSEDADAGSVLDSSAVRDSISSFSGVELSVSEVNNVKVVEASSNDGKRSVEGVSNKDLGVSSESTGTARIKEVKEAAYVRYSNVSNEVLGVCLGRNENKNAVSIVGKVELETASVNTSEPKVEGAFDSSQAAEGAGISSVNSNKSTKDSNAIAYNLDEVSTALGAESLEIVPNGIPVVCESKVRNNVFEVSGGDSVEGVYREGNQSVKNEVTIREESIQGAGSVNEILGMYSDKDGSETAGNKIIEFVNSAKVKDLKGRVKVITGNNEHLVKIDSGSSGRKNQGARFEVLGIYYSKRSETSGNEFCKFVKSTLQLIRWPQKNSGQITVGRALPVASQSKIKFQNASRMNTAAALGAIAVLLLVLFHLLNIYYKYVYKVFLLNKIQVASFPHFHYKHTLPLFLDLLLHQYLHLVQFQVIV